MGTETNDTFIKVSNTLSQEADDSRKLSKAKETRKHRKNLSLLSDNTP